MQAMGYPWVIILRVKNSTDKVIDEVEFVYNYQEGSNNIKNIKSGYNKQTGVCTLYDVKNLRMYIKRCNKYFMIKEYAERGYQDTLIIDILEINENDCKFEIYKEK